MKKLLIFGAILFCAQAKLLGVYASIDEDGKRTALWEISEQGGFLEGKIIKLEGHSDETICEKCKKSYKGFSYAKDASKMKLVGAPLLYGLAKKDAQSYEGGYIIDPKSGKQYSANATLDGDKLILRGYIGFSLIGRTQTWLKQN